jgi:hypothetical protein
VPQPTAPPPTPHKRVLSRIFGARKKLTEARRKFHYETLYITFVQALKSRIIICPLCFKEMRSARRVRSGWLKGKAFGRFRRRCENNIKTCLEKSKA